MKCPNVSAALYDGKFDASFDCAGVEACRFALCPIMPPTGEEECVYREYGACRCIEAQAEALEALYKKIKSALKNLENQDQA